MYCYCMYYYASLCPPPTPVPYRNRQGLLTVLTPTTVNTEPIMVCKHTAVEYMACGFIVGSDYYALLCITV